MGRFLIVSLADKLDDYEALAREYGVGFEYNDFYGSDVLDDENALADIIGRYEETYVPEYCTMHGAFIDVVVFSQDKEIARISKLRIRQSLEVARRIKAKGVVFHTNVNPYLTYDGYMEQAIEGIADYLEELLKEYRDINIYVENMFDDNPYTLLGISKRLSIYDNYGVCLDYAHASLSHTDMDIWIKELHSFVKHLHINDNDLIHDLHMPVGAGRINWNTFRDFYLKYFRDCSVLIETTDPSNQRESIEYLKQLGIM